MRVVVRDALGFRIAQRTGTFVPLPTPLCGRRMPARKKRPEGRRGQPARQYPSTTSMPLHTRPSYIGRVLICPGRVLISPVIVREAPVRGTGTQRTPSQFPALNSQLNFQLNSQFSTPDSQLTIEHPQAKTPPRDHAEFEASIPERSFQPRPVNCKGAKRH